MTAHRRQRLEAETDSENAINLIPPRFIRPLLTSLVFVGIGILPAACEAAIPSASLSEQAEARRWAAAKFEGAQASVATEPALVVLANHGPVQKNARGGRPMRIVDQDYTRGLYCHAPSMLAHNLPRARDGKPLPPILTSCSGGFFPGIHTSEESERQFINAFAQAGVKLDYWWIDAGWYTCPDWPQTGTWTPDPIRYPRGFKPVSELARSKGMGLIVWFEPERVRPGSFLYTNNPAWLLGIDGHEKLLNLGHPDARRWLTDHVDAMLTRDGINFYRQDFNINPLGYWRDNDAPDRQGLLEMRHIEGYLAYWDELRRRHPGLPMDSCASGGRRNDLETLRRAVPLLRSDYQAFDGNPAYAPGNQGHTYGLSSWIPYYGHGVYFTERDFVYSVRSYLSPAFGICADVRKPGVDWALIRRVADQWRQVADCFLGDFYPLTSHPLNEELWLAWQFDLPEQNRGMVQVFRRAGSNYESARFKLRNLNPAASYVVTDLDQPSASCKLSGRELVEHGFLISAPEQPSARLITYQQSTKDS